MAHSALVVRHRFTRTLALLCSGVAVSLMGADPVLAETLIGASASVDTGYSSSPFNSAASKSAVVATARLSPDISFRHETGAVDLSASVIQKFYSRAYSDSTDYAASASLSQVLSARTNLGAQANFSSSTITANDFTLQPGVLPGGEGLPPVIDPSSASFQGQRRTTFSGGVNVGHQLSGRDSLSVSASAAVVRGESGSTINDYNSGSVSASYSRQLNERISLGLSMSVGRSDYLGTRIADSTTYSPAFNASFRLPRKWRIEVNGGVTFLKQNTPAGTENKTFASGTVTVCHEPGRLATCLTASRSVAPSSNGTVGVATSAGINASYKTSDRGSVSAALSYATNERTGIFGGFREDYINSSASYSHKLSRRITANVNVGYADSFESVVARKANFSVSVGVRCRIGSIK